MIKETLFDVTGGSGVAAVCVLIIIVCAIRYIINSENVKELEIKFTIMQKVMTITPAIVCIVYLSIYSISLIRIYDTPYDYQEDKPANSIEYLVGLNDNSGIRGNIRYIGRGYIESNMYYNYMVDCGPYMKQSQLNATTNDIRIIVSSTETPRIEWRTKRKTCGPFYKEDKYWNIYIPENAINDTISIDMK